VIFCRRLGPIRSRSSTGLSGEVTGGWRCIHREVRVLVFVALGVATSCSGRRDIEAGFWFESVSFSSPRVGGRLTEAHLETVRSIATSELTNAFAGLRINFSQRQDASFRVRVVQELWDPRFRRRIAVAGQSRAVSGFAGDGAVSFDFLASGATTFASADLDAAAIVVGIGRGIGRAAVHEFVHQLLPRVPIDGSKDVESYEHGSAARREQYYGPMHWDLAWPLLQKRIGVAVPPAKSAY
jgi:hypothetical protein